MSYMTKIDGVADTDDALPGMAFFAGTGPYGKTCGDCKFRGLTRQSQKATYNESRQEFVHKSYRTTQCVMFKKLAGIHGTPVKADYPACKYFETKEKKKTTTDTRPLRQSQGE
jgi:hypothetical protein